MRNFASLVGALVLSTLSACAVYRPPSGAPTLPLATEFSNGKIAAETAVAVEAWWKGFEDSSLNALIDEALERNTDLRVALANVNASRALRGLQRSEYLPNGGIEARVERSKAATSTMASGASESAMTAMDASWELDLFGRVLNANRIAASNQQSQEAALDAARMLVVAETASTYFRIRTADRKIAAREGAVLQQRAIVELTRAMSEEARVSLDVLDRALAELANDEGSLLREREERRRLEHRLAVVLGRQPGQWRIAETAEDARIQFRPIDLGNVESLLRNRPDVRIATHSLVARQAALKLDYAGYFPTVSITGAIGYLAGGFGDLGASDSATWSVVPSMRWNVLDFGRNARRVEASKARIDRAVAEYEGTVLRAIEETETALARYDGSQRELMFRERAYRHSLAAAQAATARYEEGMSPFLDVLLARRDSVAAELARADGIGNQRSATVALFTVLGKSQ